MGVVIHSFLKFSFLLKYLRCEQKSGGKQNTKFVAALGGKISTISHHFLFSFLKGFFSRVYRYLFFFCADVFVVS